MLTGAGGADPSAGASRAFDEFLSSYFTRGGEQGRVIYEPPSPGGDWELTSERRRDEAKLGCSLGSGVLRLLRDLIDYLSHKTRLDPF